MANCYYSGAGNGSNCFELYDKTRLQPDIELIHNSAEEIINTLGQKIDYYVNTYTTLCADNVYGEQPTSVFWGPKVIKMRIELDESALALSQFGFNVNDEVTAFVTIRGYVSAFSGETIYTSLSQEVAPKSGDVFKMSEYGSDRPGNRGGNFFQVTERRDQDISGEMNPLGGHYMWRLKAKRMDYSFEPGLSGGETGNNQVFDDTFSGVLTSFYDDEFDDIPNFTSPAKIYPGSVDKDSTSVFDMSVNNTDVYGLYSVGEN